MKAEEEVVDAQRRQSSIAYKRCATVRCFDCGWEGARYDLVLINGEDCCPECTGEVEEI